MKATPTKPSVEELDKVFDDAIGGADTQRTAYLGDFQRVRSARANLHQREISRLEKKYGAEHPRVAALRNRQAANGALLFEVMLERKRATLAVPDVDNQSWTVFGWVRDTQGTGVPHLTVVFYDRQGRWIENFGFACTKPDGSFSLMTANVPPTRAAVGLRLLRDGKAIYADPRPLYPALGRADYREIILGGDETVCAPPDSPGSGNPGFTDDPKPPPPPEPRPAPGDTAETSPAEILRADPLAWIVHGRITDLKGRGLGGMQVTVYDADLLFDDKLGMAVTDERGGYVLTYHKKDFRDLFETSPDLYLQIADKQGNRLGNTKDAVRCEAGTVEEINLTVQL